jgi:hypothetical protein
MTLPFPSWLADAESRLRDKCPNERFECLMVRNDSPIAVAQQHFSVLARRNVRVEYLFYVLKAVCYDCGGRMFDTTCSKVVVPLWGMSAEFV